jgi:hypothetical protein
MPTWLHDRAAVGAAVGFDRRSQRVSFRAVATRLIPRALAWRSASVVAEAVQQSIRKQWPQLSTSCASRAEPMHRGPLINSGSVARHDSEVAAHASDCRWLGMEAQSTQNESTTISESRRPQSRRSGPAWRSKPKHDDNTRQCHDQGRPSKDPCRNFTAAGIFIDTCF